MREVFFKNEAICGRKYNESKVTGFTSILNYFEENEFEYITWKKHIELFWRTWMYLIQEAYQTISENMDLSHERIKLFNFDNH